MSEEYGDIAATLIEVHHTTPVHTLGPGYVINPEADLVPLLRQAGFANAVSLAGGIDLWSRLIDPAVPRY